MPAKRVSVLLVEDNPADIDLMRMTLSDEFRDQLRVVQNGEAALRCLRSTGEFAGEESPNLVILDLNLPGIDGRTILKEIKTDPELKAIPVIVLTHSTHHADAVAVYKDYANCFISKPMDLADFRGAISAIERFWFATATLP